MSTASSTNVAQVTSRLPRLEPGDALDQPTFHARYESMPEGTRAELIGGIVYMPSPMKLPHSKHQRTVSWWLKEFEFATPGTEGGDGLSVFLSDADEPQPDACLFIPEGKGGQARVNDEDYLVGAPEFVVEIASSSAAIDLHAKKAAYERAGVREYLVVALQQQIFGFVLRNGKFQVMQPDDDQILRSEVFPGLWLDPEALLKLDHQRIRAALLAGVASAEHAAFVEKMK